MAASKLKLYIEQGATFQQHINWSGGDPVLPIDLTGYTARMQIRPSVKSDTLLIELTTENGAIILGGATGDITLVLTATQTAGLSFSSAVYDLELVNPSGYVTRLVYGDITLSPEVTRA